VTARNRVWARLGATGDLEGSGAVLSMPSARSRFPRRLAFAAAALALAAAALGPIPATGLAGHPAAEAVDAISRRLVASESPPALEQLPAPQIVDGRAITAQEASRILGLSVSEPAAPPGFHVTSSEIYGEGADGVYAISYESADGAIVVTQEAASGYASAAGGTSTDIALPDGNVAVFTEGAWDASGDELTWKTGAKRSLVFERDGVLATISAHGPEIGASVMLAIASSID
jgi:hypothetical protein